ncbi:MAG: maleylpyruvate isomerase family mycothiol-dependent enzyme [Dehalococcoidia bacterium]|nr:maleylpyruvate isomerase family mycothiol-dependent enzyme [Dehalococcoidia bacterium]
MTATATRSAVRATEIPPLTRAQAANIARDELAAFVSLLEELDEPDWRQPTHCDLWDVHDVVAHQGGHVAAGHGLLGMLGQGKPWQLRPYKKRGMNDLDAINQRQVDLRHEMGPAELITEVRDGTERAITARQRMKWPSRIVRLPAPDYGLIPMDYLLHVIFPRDMWIHRLDIADATDRPFTVTPDHDGAMLPPAIRDMDRNVRKHLPGHSVRLTIDGPAGGTWLLGEGDEFQVTMDLPAFLRASSGRIGIPDRVAAADFSTPDQDLRERIAAALVAVY